MDITALIAKFNMAWVITENPSTKFVWDDKIKKQLAKVAIPPMSIICLAQAKMASKATGECNGAIQEFEARQSTAMEQTLNKFH